MALDYVETSKKIIKGVGGAGNIASATHCMTRLRLVLKDEGKAADDEVKKIKGVKSVIKQGGQYQIVIGNEVSNVFKEMNKLGNFSDSAPAAAPATKGNPVQRIFGYISSCMTPLLPALLGTGMVKVILTLLTTFAGLGTDNSTYIILNAIGDCFLLFFPVFLSYTTAKKLGGNPVLFMLVGTILVYPDLLTLLAGNSLELGSFLGMPSTTFIGIPVITATYTSSVLPILLMGPIMKWVEDFADRVSPNVIKSFLKPLIFLFITAPVALIVIGPLGNVVGNGLSFLLDILHNACGWLALGIMGALMPFIIMTGMHYALIPLMMNALANGFDPLVLVPMFAANLAQGGAALGVGFKSKDTEIRSEGIASGISAILAGVTEPALYGTNMRFRTPMIGACIGGGVAGLFLGLSNVVAYAFGGSPSIFSIITFIGGDDPMHGAIFGGIGAAITLALSLVISFMLYKDEIAAEPETSAAPAVSAASTAPAAPVANTPSSLVDKFLISSPLTGKIVPLEQVPDEVFSTGTLGEGAAIIPTVGKVLAPFDGTISSTMDTMHAVGISADNGLELLIHVGLNTVELKGKCFSCKVAEDDVVKKGDVLIEFDIEGIKAAGYPLYTPVLVTNSDDYVSVKVLAEGETKAGDDLISVV